jgi:hypothetical protein
MIGWFPARKEEETIMRSSIVTFVAIAILAILVLAFGLVAGRARQKKAEEFDELAERVSALEQCLDEAKTRDRSQTMKLDELEKRLKKLEGKAKE